MGIYLQASDIVRLSAQATASSDRTPQPSAGRDHVEGKGLTTLQDCQDIVSATFERLAPQLLHRLSEANLAVFSLLSDRSSSLSNVTSFEYVRRNLALLDASSP